MVLNKNGEQYHKHLLLTRRQLIRHEGLTNLGETYLILCAHNLLASFLEEIVYKVLETLLRFAYILCFLRIATLKRLYDAVAHVHLIVKILALKLIQLPVKFSNKPDVHSAYHIAIHYGTVERTYHIEAQVSGIGRIGLYMHTFEQVIDNVAIHLDTLHHLIYYSTLTHSIDTAKHVHASVKIPNDMPLAAPKRVNLYLFNVFCVFHKPVFLFANILNYFDSTMLHHYYFLILQPKIKNQWTRTGTHARL